MRKLTKNEISLLLYLETRAVDHVGKVDMSRMNKEEFNICKEWAKEKFIHFGRIASKDIHKDSGLTNWVVLSEEAWEIAHAKRKKRFVRSYKERKWITTAELREN